MPDVPAWLLALGGVIGYSVAYLQYRAAKQNNHDTMNFASRKAIMDTYRWAAELAADESEMRRQLGVSTLTKLAEHPDLTTQDRELIVAALEVTLAPLDATWDDADDAGGTVEVLLLDPEPPWSEEGDGA